MAENAANFTGTLDSKPSIFEIIAQKSLSDTLHPALRKLALFLYSLNPRKFSWLNEYYEESFLIIHGALEYHYLKNFDATFSENFYGLKRVHLKTNKSIDQKCRILSILNVVVLPYLKRKLEEKLAIYRLQNAENSLGRGFGAKFKKSLLFCHSTFQVAWGSWILVNYLRYMSNNSVSQLPALRLLDLKLVYALTEDIPGFWTALFKGQLSSKEFSLGFVRNALATVFEVTSFFLQFLQTWDAKASNFDITALPKVPPPPLDNQAKNYEGKCPLCKQYWKNPTVLPVSGYVFCFICILKYLREYQKCPITNLPSKPLEIIRVYDNE